MRSSVVLAVLALPALLGGCARYRAAPLDVERALRPAAAAPRAGPWSFDEAVRHAIEHNPDLVALRARAAAVNLDPSREPVEAGAAVDSDHRVEFDASLDALSLLGLGIRPYDVALACARRNEALMAHHARAREIAGEIAECFVVAPALGSLADPDSRVDVSAFVRAGLESASAETAAAATAAGAEAERFERDTLARTNRLTFVRLLGLPPTADVGFAPIAPGWPVVGEPTPSALVAARADVQVKVAAFEAADREIRRAVQAQYPTVLVGTGVALDPTSLFGAVRLKLPVGLSAEVRALEAAREAARADVESAVLDALRDAAISRAEWGAAESALAAAKKRGDASAELLKAARVRLSVGSGSPIEMVFSADAVVDAAVSYRSALLGAARARVKAARAAGWPASAP